MFKEQIKELTNMFERLADEIEETERSLKVKKLSSLNLIISKAETKGENTMMI